MKIFYGPPGTGKTYCAAREAVRIIDGHYDPETVRERHRQLVAEGSIRWVSFHPSYAYEDFVEGYRPRIGAEGTIIYVPTDGPFKDACEACRRPPRELFRVGETLGRYEVVHINSGGVALRSEVRRVDRASDVQHTFVDFWTIERFRSRSIPPDAMSIAGPRVDEKRELAAQLELPPAFWTSSSPYRVVYEAMLERTGGFEPRPVVLVIDEINRADLSRVFGELLTILEIDKREGANEEARVTLPYSGEQFAVPMGLSLIGTMNTADRSLAVFDVALRRRFDFEEVNPDPEMCPVYGGVSLSELLAEWNRRISVLRSRDYRLGHAELMLDRLEMIRTRENWADDTDGQLRAVALVLRKKILPLLLDYFPDDWRKADLVLGPGTLLETEDNHELVEYVQEALDVDIAEGLGYLIPSWWDPMNQADWDGGRLRDALAGALTGSIRA